MPRKSKTERLADLHAEAMEEFDVIQAAMRNERLQCLKDRRFYSIAGAQWEGPLGEQFANKPKFEVNKIHLAVIRIINEYRNNRITVDFVSKDGIDGDKLADTCDGLYRADEQDSTAEEAYDNAFEEAVGGGIGAWRLRTAYEDEYDDEDDRQRIRIEPIYDADSSVFFDLNAKRQDKSDAKRCYVITAMARAAYKAEYNDDPASWPKTIHQYEFDWATPDVVYVAEYYRIEAKPESVYTYQTLAGEEEIYTETDFENDETLEESLSAVGTTLVSERKVRKPRVHKYILNGNRVLEDCGIIAGRNIPIVVVYGKRWFVDNVERCMGHVRLAIDSQRLGNMQRSKLGELAAYSGREKPIFTPEQMAGHQVMWSDDSIEEYPYLLVNSITDANGQKAPSGPIGYTKAPMIPPAMAALMQITEQDMQDILGNQGGADKMVSNIGADTVEMIQTRLDMQTFIYISNFAKGVRRSGAIWLSMAADVYIEAGRKMKAIGSDGTPMQIEIQRPVMTKEGQEVENDLSKAKLDVVAEVGPSSESKRAATVRSLTNMMGITQDPETLQVLSSMALMNMQGEGVTEVRDFFRQRLIKMGAVKPTEEEKIALAEEKQNEKLDPNALYLQAAAENEVAKATKARAETVLTVARADETRANTIETMAKVDAAEQAQALEVIDRFNTPQPEAAPVTAVVVDPQ